jgi:glutamate/tyrosine decarboxylase-like PLP-dependent enzyme
MDSLSILRQRCAEAFSPIGLDPALLGVIANRVKEHHESLPQQSIGDNPDRVRMEALLRESAPEKGQSLLDVMARFDAAIAPHACRVDHPRFLAFVPSSATAASIAGDWLCSGFNFFAGVWVEGAGPSCVELVVLDWFRSLLGLPIGSGGLLTSGGSEANLTALLLARERVSFTDRPRSRLYFSVQRHWSIDRSAYIAGFSPEQFRLVNCDSSQRIDVAQLQRMITEDRKNGLIPLAIVANAGTTNTGAVDPLIAMAEISQRESLWFHVDAAYGWAACLSEEGKESLAGIEQADSVTFDPHKWFAQPFDIGALLVRDESLLAKTFAMKPEYMQDVEADEQHVNFADRGLALTRRFRALKVWFSVQLLGLQWFRGLVRHCMNLAKFSEQLIIERGYELVSGATLSVVSFRFGTDEEMFGVIDRIRATGDAFLATTKINSRVAIRLCFINWRTTAGDVERVFDLIDTLRPRATTHG